MFYFKKLANTMASARLACYLPVFLVAISEGVTDGCRQLWFQEPTNGLALINHVIATMEVPDLELCQIKCYLEPKCVSLNLGPSKENSKRNCELCDADGRTYPHELNAKLGYLYQGLIKNGCLRHTCARNATCQAGFTEKQYRCICPAGFTGEQCQIALTKTAIICENEEKSITCSNEGKIQVTFANFGRLDNHTCPHNKYDYQSQTNCRAQTSLARVQAKCHGKTSCDLKPSNSFFDGDPCPKIFKYLLVKYQCEN